MKIEKELPKIKKNILLKNHTTFKIGGRAKYFFEAKTTQDIISAVKIAKKYNLPFFILGGGSNLLIADKGFNGLVIKIENKKYAFKNFSLFAEAGVELSKLVKETAKLGLSGLEWAAGIPGTLGGAIRGNAGAFGSEIKDNILKVECLDTKGNLRKLSQKQCDFAYRSSIFKKKNWIVLSAILKLKKGDAKTIKDIVNHHLKYRKQRHPLEYPNTGSIFKNYPFKKLPQRLKNHFSKVVKKDPFMVVPAAYIISEAGLKNFKIGQAQVSEKHPNFIVNLNQAKARDVRKLINYVKQKVRKKFGIELQEEICYLGFEK